MAKVVENILVLVDGTEQSITATQYAILLAKAVGARLTAMYVVNTRALNDLVKARIFLQAEQDEYQLDLQADAERYLNHVRELAERKGVSLETIKTSGTVHQEVRNEIAKRKVDLLVIGELAGVRSRRDEFYDEAERALRTVPCSVLVVKDEDHVFGLYEALQQAPASGET
jgi:nucleotide-binding universal stress UspA family protein